MVSQSLDADENPITSIADIITLINQCDTVIEAAQDVVSNAYRAFDQYELLGIRQCTPVINTISHMSEPIQKLYERLGESAFPFQGRLLTELYHVQKQAEKLKSNMSTFRAQVVIASPQEIIRLRRTIRKQLISLQQQLSIVSSLLIEGAYDLTVNYQDNDWFTAENRNKGNQIEAQRYKESKVEMLRRIKMKLELNLLSVKDDQVKYVDPRNVPPDLKRAADLISEKIEEVNSQLVELENPHEK